MRSVFLCLAMSALFAVPPAALAQSAGQSGSKPISAEHKKSLDELFVELKRENKEHAARRIADRIWAEWRDSGSASINVMMQWADEATKAEKWGVALDFLDRVTVLDPDFAEGWNRRATVHFMMKNYAKSMADIDRTLRLEPRHFGALAGMAQILKDQGQKQLALNAYERVLQVYPMMRSAQAEVVTLSDELAGEGI
jgi:tetratricopeptide (TPR) repeat protein